MRLYPLLLIFLSATVLCGAAGAEAPPPLYDLEAGRLTTLEEATARLLKSRVILVGELHTEESHHRAQLAVVRRLVQAGARVAIGLEMFRRDSQPDLDRWTAGAIGEREFEAVYRDNWNFPWPLYRPIFEYARQHKIPLIGLNVAREITRQVARSGFGSLTEAQRGELADVACAIDEEYLRSIRKAYQAHAHGNMNFTFFCEAQMVWDTAMAVYALERLKTDPETTVVILTGAGHAQKGAVPRQLRMRAEIPVTVLLPEVPGGIDRRTADLQDADYLLLELK